MNNGIQDSDVDESIDDSITTTDYVALSLYYLDGPVTSVDVRAKIGVLEEKKGVNKQVSIFQESEHFVKKCTPR